MNAEEIRTQILREMAPAKKWEIAQAMIDSARALKRGMLRAQHPDWSEEEVREAEMKWFRNERA